MLGSAPSKRHLFFWKMISHFDSSPYSRPAIERTVSRGMTFTVLRTGKSAVDFFLPKNPNFRFPFYSRLSGKTAATSDGEKHSKHQNPKSGDSNRN